MPSHDILDKLFGVEKKAEELAIAAREEADKRVAVAKEEAEAAFESAYAARVAELSSALEKAKKQSDVAFKGELAAYRARLEAAKRDDRGFDALCDRLLAGKA